MKPLGIDQIQDIMAGKPIREPASWRRIKIQQIKHKHASADEKRQKNKRRCKLDDATKEPLQLMAQVLTEMHSPRIKSRRYFGTDGIRGRVGVWPITR